ncbi:MAG: DUF4139 domain-containing protein [Phycisphaerae bacterium]|nr:DUF4139 domain-containing protein [Phycisphaerae bacterium]
MNPHLTEDLLIQLQFDLLEPTAANQARQHLVECESCRILAGQLQAKFASLDLLREEMAVPEGLIERAIVGAAHRTPSRRMRPMMWLSAAAAILVVGVGAAIFVQQFDRQSDQGKSPITFEMARPTETPKQSLEEKAVAVVTPAKPELLDGEGISRFAADSVGLKTDNDIDATPPFAPASAIELVTLPRRDELQLTIYNSADLTLVRERRNLTLKRGWNWLQLMWVNTRIDPTSLTLEPLEQKDKVLVQQLVYPARLKQIGRWLIRSEVTGQVPMEVTYLTSGISWRAFYMGTLVPDESKLKLDGFVRVDNNSGEEYENAQTRLVVGQVHLLEQITELSDREWAWGRHDVDSFSVINGPVTWDDSSDKLNMWNFDGDMAFGLGRVSGFGGFGGAMKVKEVLKEGLSEYNLYTIEGLETIPHSWGKRLPSFKADEIPVESVYKYDPSRWGTETNQFLSFTNDKEHKLGANAMPEGDMRIFRDIGEAAHLTYVGTSAAKYIPVNEKVELDLGPTPYVKIEPVVMDEKTDSFRFDNKGNITGWDDIRTMKVTVTNTRDIAIKVEYFQNFDTQYWKLKRGDETGTYEQEDLDTAKFTLKLEPRSKTIFEYSTTIFQGTRQEDWKP